MHWKILLVLFFSVIVYLLLGAVGFHYIEGPTEDSLHVELRSVASQFMSQYTCIDANNMTKFLTKIMNAYKAGYTLGENGTIVAPAPKWDYMSSVFFCMTIITTIGYGNLSPSTMGGQVFCCIYAIIGIPLLGIMLSGIAERVKSIKERVQNCECWRDNGKVSETVSNILYFLIGFVLFFIIPAAIFTKLEGWNYSVGLYYCFVTLSTIGFGDYVAGQTVTSAIYKFCLSAWIYTGLVFMSGIISMVQELIERGTKNAEAKVEPKATDDDEEPQAAEPTSAETKDAAGNDSLKMEVLS